MEMLISIKQEMKEIDNQLKIQLQLRDEYLDAEVRRRDQNLEDAVKQRDEELRPELEKMDTKWRIVIKDREVAFWTETEKHKAGLIKMLEDRDNALKAGLESRDKNWLDSLEHCKKSFCLMTYEQVNNKTLLESLAKRQRELTKSNAKILDWVIKIVSNKKKVTLLQIRISDCVPCTIVPHSVKNPPIPFSNLNLEEKRRSKPCNVPAQNKTPSATRKKELTPVEEV